MLIKIRPLKGAKPFSLECEKEASVGALKIMIFEKLGEAFPVESQKVVINGKVLEDEQTLAGLNFKPEKDFFVVAVARKKKKPKEPVVEKTETKAEPKATTETPAAQEPAATAPVVTDEKVQQVVGMGFAEQDARAALEVAEGNVPAAIEFIMNPALLEAARQRNAQVQQQQEAAKNQTPLERFRNSPNFNTVRQLLLNNPQAMGTVLAEMETGNPELFAYLNENPERLQQMVEMLAADDGDAPVGDNANPFGDNQAATQAAPGGVGNLGPLAGLGGAGGMEQMTQFIQQMQQLSPEDRQALLGQYGLPPNALEGVLDMLRRGGAGGGGAQAPVAPRPAIQLTAEEEADVANLVQLGFSRVQCVQAYLACEKNMEQAANLLFTNPPDDPTQNQDNAPPPPPNNNPGPGDGGDAGAGDI